MICSDSHGSKARIDKLFENYKFDYFIFLGDGLTDLGDWELLGNVYAVSGNCDFFSVTESERMLEIACKQIFITHGHKYGVKYGLATLSKYARNHGADIVLYGHTHNYNVEDIDGITFANPGTLKGGSAMMLTINGKKVNFERIIL